MKKLVYAFVLLFTLFACNREPKPVDNIQNESKNDSVPTTIYTEDDVPDEKPTRAYLEKYFTNDGGWIQVRNALSADQTGMYIYFQAPDDVARNLRLRIQYYGSSTYKFTIDGKAYTYKANRSQNSNDKRFVEGSSTSWYDNSVKKNDLKFLEALASSRKAVLTIGGSDINIDDRIKKDIRRTLDYFEAMDGLLPKSNMVNIRRM